MTTRRTVSVSHRGEPVLGSALECRVAARNRRRAQRAIQTIVDCIEGWEQLLSAYRPSSELRRWVDGDLTDAELSPAVCEVLQRGKHWETATGGVVTPLPGGSSDQFEAAADGSIRRLGDLTGLRLDAFAKGFIVDRAVDAATAMAGVVDVMVSVGGDLRAVGPVGVNVGIENPARPYDNEPPHMHVEVTDAALATSGLSRRGSHIYDGRTGAAADDIGSVVVRAPTLEAADAWATALYVEPRLADSLGLDAWFVDHSGAPRPLTGPT